MSTITIIGSGLAAYTLAREFRKLDKTTALRIITADNADFYSKPMLSNALTKQQTPEKLVNMSAVLMAEKESLEIISHCTVSAIDRTEKIVHTDKGEFAYRDLIIATGAEQIKPGFAGDAANSVITVNSLTDYADFYQQLQGKKHITILGAGLIGCEFANDLMNAGYQVSLIDLADRPLSRLLPEYAANHLKQKLSALGIQWHLKHTLTHIDKVNSTYKLSLNDGTEFTTDLVLSAIGLRPNIALADAAGVAVNRGIVVDDFMQTSDEHIYALGDCAEINHNLLPYVMPIMVAARALAKTLNGDKTNVVFPAMPVIVKTPVCPVVVCPPADSTNGAWIEEKTDQGVISLYKTGNILSGFALTDHTTTEKQALLKLLGRDQKS